MQAAHTLNRIRCKIALLSSRIKYLTQKCIILYKITVFCWILYFYKSFETHLVMLFSYIWQSKRQHILVKKITMAAHVRCRWMYWFVNIILLFEHSPQICIHGLTIYSCHFPVFFFIFCFILLWKVLLEAFIKWMVAPNSWELFHIQFSSDLFHVVRTKIWFQKLFLLHESRSNSFSHVMGSLFLSWKHFRGKFWLNFTGPYRILQLKATKCWIIIYGPLFQTRLLFSTASREIFK